LSEEGDAAMNLLLEPVETDERFVIDCVDWDTYEKFLAAVGDRRIFLTYDGERLEFMSPSRLHEFWGHWLGLLLNVMAQEWRVPIRGFGSATWRSKKSKRGLEADKCFYIQNIKAVLGKKDIDLRHDPAPDLAIEIDISPSAVDRMEVYAALGVGELWCFDGVLLRFFRLGTDKQYHAYSASPTFPFFDGKGILELSEKCLEVDDIAAMELMRQWVRQRIAAFKKEKNGPRKRKPKE
jgi:Uma2 family endonuclease